MPIHTRWRRCTDTLPRTVLDCSRRRCPASLSACASILESHVPRWNTSHSASMRNFMNEWRKTEKKTVSFFLQMIIKFLTQLFSGQQQLLHGLRVAFGFTFYDHGVFGVNNMILHRLLYDGWGLPDCRRRNKSSLVANVMRQYHKHAFRLLTHLPEGCPEPKHSAKRVAAVLVRPVSPSSQCMETSSTSPDLLLSN